MRKYIYSPHHLGLVLAPLMTEPNYYDYLNKITFAQAEEAYNTWLSSPPIYKVRPEDIEWFSVERGEDEFEVKDRWKDSYAKCELVAIPKKGNEPDHIADAGKMVEKLIDHAKEQLHFTECDGRYKAGFADAIDFVSEWLNNNTPVELSKEKGNESKEQSPSVDRIKELAVDFAFENFPKSGVTYQDVIKLFDEWLSNNQYHQKRLLIHQPYK
jgi:hypothetical protein